MATAVTLKKPDGTEIYPVTDISLVNNGIHAVDVEATTPVPAVETDMIADDAVTAPKIDFSDIGNTCTTIWSGNLYQTGSSNKVTLDEPIQYGRPYIITAYGLSGSYLMEFIFTARSGAYQAAYYDGTNSCRWRINFLNASGGGTAPYTQMYLDAQSQNMGANTAIIRVAKLVPADQS